MFSKLQLRTVFGLQEYEIQNITAVLLSSLNGQA
jgi:hypothetical protein